MTMPRYIDTSRKRDVPSLIAVASLIALVLTAAFVVLVVASAMVTPAAAQATTTNTPNNSSYYENESANINDSAWFAGYENVTLDSIVGMATRVGPYIIGTGQTVPGGVGYTGPIILGLVVTGVFLGAVAGTNMGASGGIVVALVTAYGLIDVGLAPQWLKVVVLMILGVVAAVVAIRAAR